MIFVDFGVTLLVSSHVLCPSIAALPNRKKNWTSYHVMHRHAMDEDQHQQVMEDLANDFLCYRSSFVSTADPPRRRRRQRPERACESNSPAVSCSQLDSPLVRSSSGPPAIANHAQKSSKGASPQSTSSKHDSMRAPFARKFLWTHKSRPDSPLPHAPRHQHVCVECAARARLGGKVPAAAADTSELGGTFQSSAIPRSQSEPLLEARKPLLHWAQRGRERAREVGRERESERESARARERESAQRPVAPVELPQQRVGLAAPSLRNVAAGRRSVHLKAIAHALIATFSLRDLPRGITNADVAMLAWEHTERLELAAGRQARAGEVGAHGEVASKSPFDHSGSHKAAARYAAPPVERQAARKLLRATSSDALLRGDRIHPEKARKSDALLRGSTSRALSLIRENGFGLTNRAGV